jgi:phage major head subunit gpT-like protein
MKQRRIYMKTLVIWFLMLLVSVLTAGRLGASGIETLSAEPGLLLFPVAGMIINQAGLAAIYKGFKTVFNEAFGGVETFFQRVAMVVPSSVREETYAWLGAFPKMREWVGDRHIKNLKAHKHTITNKDWETTVEVDRNDIEDDAIGVYKPLIAEMGRAAAVHPDELIAALLAAGFSSLCFDGQYFFDTDHPVGDGTVANFGGGAGTAWYLLDASRQIKPLIFQTKRDVQFVGKDRPEDDNVFMRKKYLYGADRRDNGGYGLWQLAYASKDTLNAANYGAARAAMMAFKDDEGKPLGVMPSLLVVPPTLEGAAREILLNEREASGATNKWRNTAELLVTPWLS